VKRRQFITLLGGAAVAWPTAARAQQGERVRRLGVLNAAADDADWRARSIAFWQALEQLGWIDGRNIRIDDRWGESDAHNIRKYAA
jgi:putative ABC transport system substrate-binding protein